MAFPVLSALAEQRAREPLGSPWTDDRWWTSLPLSSSSGIEVRAEDAISASAIWNALNIVSLAIGTLPVGVFRERPDGGRDPVRDHPVHLRLSGRGGKPNPWMKPYQYFSTSQAHIMVFGTAFTQKIRNDRGEIVAVCPLHPRRVKVEMDGGELRFMYRQENGEPVPFGQDEIMILSGLSPTGILGYNPMETNKETIGTTLAVQRHAGTFFKNYAQTSMVLKHPTRLSDKAYERLQKSIKQRTGENAYLPMVTEEGIDVTTLGLNAVDAEMIASQKYQVEEAARITNVPVHKLKNLDRATFNNVEQMDLDFVMNTIRPWVVIWEQCINAELLTEQEIADGLYVKFNITALLRGDNESRAKFYKDLWGIGAFSTNDVLEKEDMNPVPGGEQRFVPLNMVPLVDAGQMGDTTPNGRGQRSLAGRKRLVLVYERLFWHGFQQAVNIEVRAGRRALNAGREAFTGWMDTFYTEFEDRLAGILLPTITALATDIGREVLDEIGADDDLTGEMETLARQQATVIAKGYVSRSDAELRVVLDDEDGFPRNAELLLDRWIESRASDEAGDAGQEAAHQAAIAAFGLMGVAQVGA